LFLFYHKVLSDRFIFGNIRIIDLMGAKVNTGLLNCIPIYVPEAENI